MKNSRKPLIIVSMALLLAVVLAMGGVTFAKYISTTNTGTNTATVAAWGFTLSTEYGDMFGPTYDWNTADPAVVVDADDTGRLVVKADTNVADNLVAPGTKGSMSFTIGGTAEVLSQFYVTATGADVALKKDGTEVYSPITWTLVHKKVDNSEVVEVNNGTIEAVLEKINALNLTVVEANSAAADILGTYTISWQWDFEEGAVDSPSNSSHVATYANDAYDTILGQIAANNAQTPEGYTADLGVSIYVDITVAQIQTVVTANP